MQFVETWFKVSPDAGTGSLEAVILSMIGAAVLLMLIGALGRLRRARLKITTRLVYPEARVPAEHSILEP
jgi:uncharacterized membrane protein YeaQ/YmgE (transglycosylase-associated protein family)